MVSMMNVNFFRSAQGSQSNYNDLSDLFYLFIKFFVFELSDSLKYINNTAPFHPLSILPQIQGFPRFMKEI